MDVGNQNHQFTLLFFHLLAESKANSNPKFRGCFSPSYQERIIEAIVEAMNNEWANKERKDIIGNIEAVSKVHSALDLGGEHLSSTLLPHISLFELARYFYDENEIYIVTNYSEQLKKDLELWKKNCSIEDGVYDFNIISPSEAIALMVS